MRLSDAYEKVLEGIGEAVTKAVAQDTGGSGLNVAASMVTEYMFDGALKRIINLQVEEESKAFVEGVTAENLQERLDSIQEDLTKELRLIMVSYFALGYTLFAPEFAGTSRDGAGLTQRMRECDRDSMKLLERQIFLDSDLMDKITTRAQSVAEFGLMMVQMLGLPPSKFGLKTLFEMTCAIACTDGFIAGAKSREMLEMEMSLLFEQDDL